MRRSSFYLPNGLLPFPSYRPASPAGRKAKAAWAVTLAQHTGKRDIVIAQAVNGHLGATVHAAGFCLNTLPVRVSLADLATGQDLLDCVQQQYIQSLPFDGVDYADILKQCTPWPVYHPGFSVVIHQNYSLEEPLQLDGGAMPPAQLDRGCSSPDRRNQYEPRARRAVEPATGYVNRNSRPE